MSASHLQCLRTPRPQGERQRCIHWLEGKHPKDASETRRKKIEKELGEATRPILKGMHYYYLQMNSGYIMIYIIHGENGHFIVLAGSLKQLL